jgi:hypothetical protein
MNSSMLLFSTGIFHQLRYFCFCCKDDVLLESVSTIVC